MAAVLQGLEEELLDPAVRRDRGRVLALLAEEFREFGSSGRVFGREEIVAWLAAEVPTEMTMREFRCGVLGEGIALVTYRLMAWESAGGEARETMRSSVWVKRGEGWRMIFHQGTKVPGG